MIIHKNNARFSYLIILLIILAEDFSQAKRKGDIVKSDEFINSFNLTKVDNQYLLSILSEKDIYIASLLEQIENLKLENYQVSQMTWR
mgnify:CR=1 FL=1